MAGEVDFKALFDVTTNAYMVLDHDLRFVAANAAYLRETGTDLQHLLGRYVFDVFPNDPADPNNASARLLQKSLESVLASGKREHLAFIPYRVPKEVAGKLVVEERFWSATHSPVKDEDGRVLYVLQHTVDVTALHAPEARSAGAAQVEDPRGQPLASASEVGLLFRAQAVQEENRKLDAEREQLQALFEQAPGFICVLEGEDFVFRLANAAYVRLVGRADLVGKPVAEALPEVIDQGFVTLLQRVCASGDPYVGMDVSLLLQRQEGASPEEVFVDFVYQPVRDASGKVRGVFVQGHDVTSRKHAEREREAAHRAAQAFSEELVEQSREVKGMLERATARIAELEAKLGTG